jgi:predicted nucleotidyltransferase
MGKTIHTVTRNTATLFYRTIGYNDEREDEERSKFDFRNEMLWVSIMSLDKILDKESLKQSILEGLSNEPEIDRILIFGSFLLSETPNDIDIAIFQNSNQNYLSLSLKYRKLLRNVSRSISLDVIPVRSNATGEFLRQINLGEVIYEKRD